MTLFTEYLAGICMKRLIPDKVKLHVECMMYPDIFAKLRKIVGFVTSACLLLVHMQLENIVSWKLDSDAIVIDAFVQSWKRQYIYPFPPFGLNGRLLQMIEEEHATALVIVLRCLTKTWLTTALRLLIAMLRLIPCNILFLPQNRATQHRLPKLWQAATMLSGSVCNQKTFLREQRISSSSPSERVFANNTRLISCNGWHFVMKNKLVHFIQLQTVC